MRDYHSSHSVNLERPIFLDGFIRPQLVKMCALWFSATEAVCLQRQLTKGCPETGSATWLFATLPAHSWKDGSPVDCTF